MIKEPINSKKRNTLLSVIIIILIVIVGMQIWLLYGALNNALDGDKTFAWATFGASTVLFLGTLYLLKFVPLKNDTKK